MDNQILCVYHDGCRDGFASAMILNFYRENNYNLIIDYQPVDPSKLYEELKSITEISAKYQKIYFLDISFTKKSLDYLINNVKCRFIIIDHHKTTYDEIIKPNDDENTNDKIKFSGKTTELTIIELFSKSSTSLIGFDDDKTKSNIIYFSNDYCGCVLTYIYFNSNIEIKNDRIPKLLLYINDRDLWKKTQDKTEEVNLGLLTLMPIKYIVKNRPDFTEWTKRFEIDDYFEDSAKNNDWIEEAAKIGEEQIKQKNIKLEQNAKNAVKATFVISDNEKKSIMLINSSEMISDMGNYLCLNNDVDFAFIYRIVGCDIWVSLRSLNNDDLKLVNDENNVRKNIDVESIAKLYGGGGHRNAAGFTIKFGKLIIDNQLMVSIN